MTYVLNADELPAIKTTFQTRSASKPTASSQPGLMQRFYAALIRSRHRSAMRELNARNVLVNEAEMVLGGFPQTALSRSGDLPFNR